MTGTCVVSQALCVQRVAQEGSRGRHWLARGRGKCCARGMSGVLPPEGVAAGGAAPSLRLLFSSQGCDALSRLQLWTFLRAQQQPRFVLEVCFTLEPPGPDGHSAVGLRKSLTLCSRGQNACLLPLLLCQEEAPGRALLL